MDQPIPYLKINITAQINPKWSLVWAITANLIIAMTQGRPIASLVLIFCTIRARPLFGCKHNKHTLEPAWDFLTSNVRLFFRMSDVRSTVKVRWTIPPNCESFIATACYNAHPHHCARTPFPTYNSARASIFCTSKFALLQKRAWHPQTDRNC